ncbi:molybdenum ABC transporter ATP-binding protein [Paracoccus seriniphilus]|uniref:molybdenum ABC transporter ATP-binding protein n=1 Tax=Paracoccus seriniphilus TaxID=184748 RepID=UPI0035658B2E
MMLSVRFQHQIGQSRIDAAFDAPAGVTALFGKSGAGKTTIVKAVAGLLRPDSGRIALDDSVLSDSSTGRFLPPHRRGIGYVFQEARLFPHLNVRQNLLYGRWFSRREAIASLPQITEMLGIGHLLNRRPAALSGGELQRVALGRAILSDPQMLLLDEPLAALDEARKSEILPYLERLRDDLAVPILYVSHSAAEIARLATTIVLVDAGRVIASGPAAAILSDPATAPLMGAREAGAILTARLGAQDEDGLTRLDSRAGPIWLPHIDRPIGTELRLRIMAQDVMIALERPANLSALNVLPATITDLTQTEGGIQLRMDAGGEALLARITARSARVLDLHPQKQVHAVLKAVSVAPGSIGTTPSAVEPA